MTLLFANNAYGSLAGPITNTATTANLAAGTGALFPNPSGGDYFKLTFTDQATGLLTEIVHVTARSTDTITMVRGQENTAARNWLAGDLADNLWTAGSAAALLQSVQQSNFFQGTDTATSGNAMTVPTVVPALTAPPAAGQIYFVTKGSNANTAAVTLLIGSGATMGTAQNVVYGDGGQLASGDWPGTASAWLYNTGTVYQLLAIVKSPPSAKALVHSGDDVSTTANTITVNNLTPPITAYGEGLRYQIKLANSITGPGAVANILSLGNRTLTRADGTSVQSGDGVVGEELDLIDDGTYLQIAHTRTPPLSTSLVLTRATNQGCANQTQTTVQVVPAGSVPWATVSGGVVTLTQPGVYAAFVNTQFSIGANAATQLFANVGVQFIDNSGNPYGQDPNQSSAPSVISFTGAIAASQAYTCAAGYQIKSIIQLSEFSGHYAAGLIIAPSAMIVVKIS